MMRLSMIIPLDFFVFHFILDIALYQSVVKHEAMRFSSEQVPETISFDVFLTK